MIMLHRWATCTMVSVLLLISVSATASAQQGNYCATCEVDGCIPGWDLITSTHSGPYFWAHGSQCSFVGCGGLYRAHCHGDEMEEQALDDSALLSMAAAALGAPDATGLAQLLTWLPERVMFNAARGAIQVLASCSGDVIGHIPLERAQISALQAIVGTGERVLGTAMGGL